MSSAPALPEWKLQLLERRRKEEEEARRREREQHDRMAKMPAWKREIIERRRAKQGSSTSLSESGGSGGTESGAAPTPATPPPCQGGAPESSVLQEKIGPVHQNPFIQLEKQRNKESAPSDSDLANAKAKQIVDLYGQIPGVRTLRADNVIIIETVPGAPPAQLASDRHSGEAKSGSVESLNELLTRRGGSVTEIRAGEVFIVKSALSRSVEDLNSVGRAEYRSSLPEQHRGRVSKLMSRFSQEDGGGTVSPRPVRSHSTENLTESTYVARKPGHLPADPSLTPQHRDSTPSPPRDLPGLTSPVPFSVASYRSQFEAKSGSGEAWPDSPPRRSPTGKTWGKEAASPERGPRWDSSDSEATYEIHPAPPPALVAEDDVQGKALANLRLHSRNSFVVMPRRATASPPPPPEPKQEASPSPSSIKPPAPTSCSSPGHEQLLPDAEEPPEAEAMRRGGSSSSTKEDVRAGGLARASSPHPAVQRRSGNTITINPRKAPVTPVTAVENGIEGDTPTATALMKKRYPTVEEIQVIGGYLSLQRSCLAKNDPHRKKSYHFDRDDVALSHMAEFLKKRSEEEREHAEKFLKYQNKRGGRIILKDIKKPEQDEWGSSLDALQSALQLEKKVNQALLDLHKLATEKGDPHLCDFLESVYLEEQVKAIKRLGDHLTNLNRLGVPQSGMGEYLFDKLTLGDSS